MNKKILLIGLLFVTFLLVGCTYKYVNPDRTTFKEDFESLNSEVNDEGVEYLMLAIPTDHPYTYTTIDEINKMLDNKESFIVLFGSNWCPWTRSMINTSIEKANEHNIEKIYYIDVREDNIITNDIRDIYSKNEDGVITLSHRGKDSYRLFVNKLKNILSDYNIDGITLEETEYENVKGINTPTFVMVKDGLGVKSISGISSLQTDPYMDLNIAIYNDIDKIFDDFFSLYK